LWRKSCGATISSRSLAAAVTPGRANRATITPTLDSTVRKARELLATSRQAAWLARSRISDSRKRLSQSGDTVVATASRITEARSALLAKQRA